MLTGLQEPKKEVLRPVVKKGKGFGSAPHTPTHPFSFNVD